MKVSYVRLYAKDFVSDFFQGLKNIIGGRLKGYEDMCNKAIEETLKKSNKKYPKAKNVSIRLDEFTDGALIVHIQGDK